MGNRSRSYRVSPAIWDNTMSPATLDAGEHALLQSQPDRLVLELPTPEGWKAELTLVLVIYQAGRRESPIDVVTT